MPLNVDVKLGEQRVKRVRQGGIVTSPQPNKV
jgi:hypothetical protein